ncbi:hypothetical protein HZ326_28731 [Fusarium oxysporum f. sp. albedinis]|nr:hypothetical protein HZ326_28731 [Fusarium oxysporum f. sp. albedinis]
MRSGSALSQLLLDMLKAGPLLFYAGGYLVGSGSIHGVIVNVLLVSLVMLLLWSSPDFVSQLLWSCYVTLVFPFSVLPYTDRAAG